MPVYNLNVNGAVRTTPDVPADMPLLWVLRDLLGVTGPKYGCGVGVCGACTSHVNGSAKRLCIRQGIDAEPVPNSAAPSVGSVGTQPIVTIEGLASEGELHPIQQAWIDEDVASCGFCQPGQIMRALSGDVGARGLLRRHAREVVRVPVRSAGVTRDVDTPADLKTGARSTRASPRLRA